MHDLPCDLRACFPAGCRLLHLLECFLKVGRRLRIIVLMTRDLGIACAQVRNRFDALKQKKYQAEELDYVPDGACLQVTPVSTHTGCSIHHLLSDCLPCLSTC